MTAAEGAPPASSGAGPEGARAWVRPELFDSDLLELAVGRLETDPALGGHELAPLLGPVADQARAAGFDQILRRLSASSSTEIWALEGAGYHLMDIGVTFARRFQGRHSPKGNSSVTVRGAEPTDIDQLLESMLDAPWGSRYDADPAYDRTAVQRLQEKWLRNSLAGRADHVLLGVIDGQAAGYVTCRLLEEGELIGEIDLVGTVPRFRGRGVAPAVVDAALAWFSARVSLVTVRTQATNTVAAGLYERAGMTLRHSDLTFRLALTLRGGNR